jgi:hypothetical protein
MWLLTLLAVQQFLIKNKMATVWPSLYTLDLAPCNSFRNTKGKRFNVVLDSRLNSWYVGVHMVLHPPPLKKKNLWLPSKDGAELLDFVYQLQGEGYARDMMQNLVTYAELWLQIHFHWFSYTFIQLITLWPKNKKMKSLQDFTIINSFVQNI